MPTGIRAANCIGSASQTRRSTTPDRPGGTAAGLRLLHGPILRGGVVAEALFECAAKCRLVWRNCFLVDRLNPSRGGLVRHPGQRLEVIVWFEYGCFDADAIQPAVTDPTFGVGPLTCPHTCEFSAGR